MNEFIISIREAQLADLDTIVNFNILLALESENKRLIPEVVQQGVKTFLQQPNLGRYFVALRQEKIVGQLAITYEWSDWRNGMNWWLQSVYVHSDFRKLGVFRQLFQHIEYLATAHGNVAGIRLYVEEANLPAQQTYKNLGFRPSGYFVLEKMFL